MPTRVINTPGITNPNATQQPKGKNVLGKDDFLKLLVGQMQYQNPLEPQKGTEFAAQLAQFSGLEQMQNMNDNMQQSMNANFVLTSSINNALAASFVGKNVKSNSDQFNWQGGSNVRLGYNLASSSSGAKIVIVDEDGHEIRTIRGTGNQGENTVLWNGKDDSGEIVDEGIYHFEIRNNDGTSISSATPFTFGKVTGIRYDQNGTVFLVDGIPVKLADILEVLNG